ncbi:adenylate/guanylate cyclase domain-containing protein [Mycobacterium sp. MS1601]|uniref:adenylate/guanylate cyclase domain-containing protein n=1 Tax=Mycobacterium sp. MS1601 TaxID=1936029 RepID=UPI0009793713|nr:adenylate/guanylate cyclase domain-containing protein [Mycobacterium sp. MS1601]AQA06678.1 adenylate/guanylate cyclase domain-containing protein [Mycobacterium sp. MS1601]
MGRLGDGRFRHAHPCVPARSAHYADSAARRFRVLKITTWIAATVSGGFGIWQVFSGYGMWQIGVINISTGLAFLAIPLLRPFGDLVAPLTFTVVAYGSIFFITWNVGTASGLQFYYLTAASVLVLILGIERIALAGVLAGLGALLVVLLEILVPDNVGNQPLWPLQVGFVTSVVSSCVLAFATVWYALREIARAEAAMEMEYERSEQLLANILPASIADRLKDPDHKIIADRYDDASILFADIAGFTERAADTPPCDLVAFLDRIYSAFDTLVEQHCLEKVKTTGDSYMVVSGIPVPRADHVQALADLALDMSCAATGLTDPLGRDVPMRIGLAAGPVVAGVVGSRRFFYDVWGDAVNVASRMETTDQVGRIQVPEDIYQRLKDDFVLEERGSVAIKGKGVMRTWYLTGRRSVQVQAPIG